MPLFFVCGTAGTGKSTVCRFLKDSGYETYDVDEDGIARWQNLKTGYMHPKSSVKASDRTSEFLKTHGWHVPREKIKELREKSIDHNIFIFGDIRNEEQLYDLFDGLIALYVDDETLKHRLLTRTDNDWGKQPHELKRSLKRHHKIYPIYRSYGAVIVDANQTIERVAADVLAAASQLIQY